MRFCTGNSHLIPFVDKFVPCIAFLNVIACRCHLLPVIMSQFTVLKFKHHCWMFFGQPFVKWLAVCCRTVVCLSVCLCMSVTLVYCGQTVGWIRMPLGWW